MSMYIKEIYTLNIKFRQNGYKMFLCRIFRCKKKVIDV